MMSPARHSKQPQLLHRHQAMDSPSCALGQPNIRRKPCLRCPHPHPFVTLTSDDGCANRRAGGRKRVRVVSRRTSLQILDSSAPVGLSNYRKRVHAATVAPDLCEREGGGPGSCPWSARLQAVGRTRLAMGPHGSLLRPPLRARDSTKQMVCVRLHTVN